MLPIVLAVNSLIYNLAKWLPEEFENSPNTDDNMVNSYKIMFVTQILPD